MRPLNQRSLDIATWRDTSVTRNTRAYTLSAPCYDPDGDTPRENKSVCVGVVRRLKSIPQERMSALAVPVNLSE